MQINAKPFTIKTSEALTSEVFVIHQLMNLWDLRLAGRVERIGTEAANADICPLIAVNRIITSTSQNAVVSLATLDIVIQ